MNANHSSDTQKDIRHIYELLESQDKGNIGIALGMLENNEEYMAMAEKRYLKFVQARLNDPKAGMSRFEEASLSEKELAIVLKHIYVQHDCIGFGMMRGEKCKLMVDTIGGIAAAFFNARDYKKHVRRLKTESGLIKYARNKGEQLLEAMKASLDFYADGWFGKILTKMTEINIDVIRMDHTLFDDANSSSVFDDFLFYLDMKKSWRLTFDIFQSDQPIFSDMFWMLTDAPVTQWGDTTAKFPTSTLQFRRSCNYRIGDDGLMQYRYSRKKRKPKKK